MHQKFPQVGSTNLSFDVNTLVHVYPSDFLAVSKGYARRSAVGSTSCGKMQSVKV